ncbi:MAG: glycine--tRNA ligase subunit beta, partial [Firmicutes bacterium]|nr:glycine--tRNA ligase subunit beta [Bacillota bacterium]
AGKGFLRSQGAAQETLEIKEFQGSEYIFIRRETRGEAAVQILKPALEKVIRNLSFPKNMRWGDYELRYARPLRWIVALFGPETIPVQVGAVNGGRISSGHRQLSPEPIEIKRPGEYVSLLKEHYVLVDAAERQNTIWNQIEHLAQKNKGRLRKDKRLLEEVTNLVEYPTAFCGEFSQDYLEVPAEVLITAMKGHQRYFPLEDETGELLPKFIGVRNGADNHLKKVIKGNEKVLAARLDDARFFFEEDSQIPLEDNLERLKGVVFQDGLGSMFEKVERIVRLSSLIAERLGLAAQKDNILRCATLAKTDLVTQMVYEFPELQGVMGEKYALLQGEDPKVALGIREHYQPRFSGDAVPGTIEGAIVSLADKSDTLFGYFAIGHVPTGSQDPFALRRQAYGVVQALIEKDLPFSLQDLIDLTAQCYQNITLAPEQCFALKEFILARLRVRLLNQGHSYDLIDAVLASGDDRITKLVKKTQTLSQFQQTPDFKDLLTAFERMSHLAGRTDQGELDQTVFQKADRDFLSAFQELKRTCRKQLAAGRYGQALINLAKFRGPVDQFFKEAMIMDKNPAIRQNRLTLLKSAVDVYRLYGDFGLIVGNK